MRPRTKTVALTLTALLVPLGATAASGSGKKAAANKLCPSGTISIGMAKAKTGGFAVFDTPAGQGGLVAVDQINAKGGVAGCKLKITWRDTKSDPAIGGQVAEGLIKDGAKIIIAPADFDIGAPASLAAKSAGVFAMSLEAGSQEWPRAAGPNFLIAGLTSRALGRGLGRFALDSGWKSAYAVTNSAFNFFTDIEKAFTPRFTSGGGKVVGKSSVADDASDYSAVVSRIKSTNPAPQVIVLSDYFPHVATFIKQLRSAGLKTPVLGNQTYSSPGMVKATGSRNLANVYYASAAFYEGSTAKPAVRKFVADYKAKYGQSPPNNNPLAGWEGMYILAAGLKKAKTTNAAALVKAITSQKRLAIGGALIYDWKNGVPHRRITMIGWKSGKAVVKATVDPGR